MAYRMTPARRAALRKAQIASARKRRKGLGSRAKSVAKSQLKYSKRKNTAKAKRQISHAKNELQLYRNVAVHGAQKLTGGKAKKRPHSKPVRRFVKRAKQNQAKYKKSQQFAKRVRRNEIRRATKRRVRR
jgi:F0F1-type ATP synthase membrane subunit b/b'